MRRSRAWLRRATAICLLAMAPAFAASPRWQQGEYGAMLERILPLSVTPAQLPQSRSRGARLVARYCVQCHNLPNPAMHAKEKWPGIVERMVVRMRGQGNMGTLMKDLMAGVEAPARDEAADIVSYLRRNSQRAVEAARYPDLAEPAAQSFRLACSQCHELPDPRRHRAAEWPQVVERMQRNMEWMNRIVGNRPDPREPQLRVDEILAFLQKHSR